MKMKLLALSLLVLLGTGTARAEYLGSWSIGDYVTVRATTHQFSTGSAMAATGDVHLTIYEDDTADQIVTNTDMAAFDGVTGLYLVKVQLLALTGFEAGKHYTCLKVATVDGVTAISTDSFQITKLAIGSDGGVTLTNGAQGGSAAVLTLDSIVISNADGPAVSLTGTTAGLTATASAGPGISASGTTYGLYGVASAGPGAGFSGTTYGLYGVASAGPGVGGSGTTAGLSATGSAGPGISASGTTYGVYGSGSAGPGIGGSGTTRGIYGVASAGPGLEAGGTTYGIYASATSGDGMALAGGTAGEGLSATGGPTGNGIQAKGGATSGVGLYASAQNNNDAGIQAVAHGTGQDITADTLGVPDGASIAADIAAISIGGVDEEALAEAVLAATVPGTNLTLATLLTVLLLK